MLLQKLNPTCDLSEVALENAKPFLYGEIEKLVVSPALIDVAEKLSWKKPFTYFVETTLPEDAWYVQNQWFGVFSPGA